MTALIAGLAGAAMTFTSSSVTEVESERRETQALYLAEAGVNDAIAQVAFSHQTGGEVSVNIGTTEEPFADTAGNRWTEITDNGDGTFTVLSTGLVGRANRTLEVILEPLPPGPFQHAIFAGNLDGDPAYSIKVNGKGSQADKITGNIYSGGDVIVDEDGEIDGEIRAGGVVSGADGQSGVRVDIPKALDVDYSVFNDYDVAKEFEGASRVWDNSGGTAGQLPESNPAHIFRKNPSDRGSDVNGTEKDDYFLEDPYTRVTADYGQDGSNAFTATLPEAANNSVFFIDGNLWLHNKRTMSLKLKTEGVDPTRVTFVVRGNIYFSDNFFYDDGEEDGVAFIAISDEEVEDSGNVYFGDPLFGTMQYAEAVMFAENNFFDNNLDARGSSKVKIRGNMTAANQVAIARDYERTDGSIAHTKLELEFDPRQANGTISLPGIPVPDDDPVGYQVAAWREVPTPRDHESGTGKVRAKSNGGGGGDDSLSIWRQRWKDKFGDKWATEKRFNKWVKKQMKRELEGLIKVAKQNLEDAEDVLKDAEHVRDDAIKALEDALKDIEDALADIAEFNEKIEEHAAAGEDEERLKDEAKLAEAEEELADAEERKTESEQDVAEGEAEVARLAEVVQLMEDRLALLEAQE